MQYAKKLALVDPKILDQLQVDREYKAIQRPAPAVAKTSLSLDISRILNDETNPDDEKVKLYGNALRRYVNIRNEIPALATDEPPPRPTVNIPPPLSPKSPDLDLTSLFKKYQPRLLKRRVQPQRSRVKSIKWDHGLRGSASPVLTATGFVNGR